MKPKVPRLPPAPLRIRPEDELEWEAPLLRVFRTRGPHVSPWSSLRTYGPVPGCRWEPMPGPIGDHPGHGVAYAATTLRTALAEVFQQNRQVDVWSGDPAYALWTPTRPLRLLDLTATWPVHNQAAGALMSAGRSVCCAWARAIHATWPDLDGLHTLSSLTSEPVVTLFEPAADSFPAHPSSSEPLAHPALAALVQEIARSIGYGVLAGPHA